MKKEVLAAVIALVITVSSAAVITGCGCNNDKKDQQSTTAPATTVASATESTTKSNKRSTQPSTQKSTANSQSDLQTIALNSYGVSAADGYSAVQTGSTNVSEGTYNIFAVYDSNGNLKTYVYIHTSGAPVFVGQDVFESNHGGNNQDNGGAQDGGNQNSVANQDGGNQNSVSNQDGGSQSSNQGGNQSSNQGGNQGGNQGYGGGGNQGGDGHDYADKGY